jgi:two-component system response regulator ChvI
MFVMASITKGMVMVVDDGEDILRVIQMGLEKAGLQVHAFSDPLAALQHIEQGCRECEVLISDVRMPKMNGFQLAKRIRQLRPTMKLVIMTAFDINKSEFESVFPSTPIDSVLRKPFHPSRLIAIVEKMSRSKGTNGIAG